MNYRSLLVLLDNGASCDARVKLALQLAQDRDCHLVGLAPTGLVDMPAATTAAAALDTYAALAWDELREQATQAAQHFRDECQAAGLHSCEAVVDQQDKAASLLAHSRCSDLLVLSQARPDALDRSITQALVEQIVLHSPRPTLVVPHASTFKHLGTNVIVAWDDSREAARAVSDALPILCHATRVDLVHWKRSGSADAEVLRERLDAVHRWLMWHGVSSEPCYEATDTDIASAMLSRAAAMDADLLVMGAYGHSRWAERLLGGATRGILASMTLPVLLSH